MRDRQTCSTPVNRARRPLIRRLLRWAIILGVSALIADFLLLPAGIGVIAARPGASAVGEPPEGFTSTRVIARDGTRLAAWVAPSRNGAAILVLPGAGDSRESIRTQAAMLAGQGFGVLALDPRGIGESEGATNRFGWAGSDDVGGAVDYLSAQPDVHAIGGWGISLGGEVLLGAIGEVPELAAVIADGATTRFSEEKFALESARGPLVQLHSWLTDRFIAAFTGDDPPAPMLDSIRANTATRLLLIAAGNSDIEIAYNRMFAEAAGDRAELWIVPGAGHTGGWAGDRDEYTRRVVRFFTEALLAPDSESQPSRRP